VDDASNVFRLNLANGELSQVTDVTTGVTGLTPTSPTLSAAARLDVLAFTIFRDGRHQLAILDGPVDRNGTIAEPAAVLEEQTSAEVVSEPGQLAALLSDQRTGLPDPTTMALSAYSPRLSLERIGQPYLSSGGGAFGSFVRAGGSLMFGDMLGGRRLGAAVQVSNRMRDVAFEARFLNQERRWNWGGIVGLAPAIRRHRLNAVVTHDGETALMKQVDYLQRVQLRAAGLVAYPFNRGLRLELTGGLRHERFHRDLRSRVSSMETGLILEEARIKSSGGAPATVGELGAALVGDTTVFGPTGPLLGSRFRLELTPAGGTMRYTSLLADYRRYVMPVRPYTLAVRVMHSGRYGPDGDDPRLLPSFLGSRSFVRGHGWDARDCQPSQDDHCGGELLGNRLLVANLELRLPVWGARSRQLAYGPLPLDVFAFADGGVAWSRDHRAPDTGARLARSLISSIGFGVRANAGGLPFEVSAVRALDGPTPGWSADFGFRTGF
jgi:hypothetical protein